MALAVELVKKKRETEEEEQKTGKKQIQQQNNNPKTTRIKTGKNEKITRQKERIKTECWRRGRTAMKMSSVTCEHINCLGVRVLRCACAAGEAGQKGRSSRKKTTRKKASGERQTGGPSAKDRAVLSIRLNAHASSGGRLPERSTDGTGRF
jgi:hypothetical protein